MATRYSMNVLDAETNEWEGIALFSDLFTTEALKAVGRSTWEEIEGAANLAIVDMDTGEAVFDAVDDAALDLDWGYNEDCGYDPYMGCYTDDC